jgi:TolB protein
MVPLMLAALAAAQIVIDVPGRADLPVAVPRPQTPSGDPDGRGAEMWDALFHDLALSGYFSLIDPAAFIEQGKGVEPGTFTWDPWTMVNAAILVKTRWLPAGHADCDPGGTRACADLYLYYVVSGETLQASRFRAEGRSPRALGHAVAGAVVKAVTGRDADFLSRIAAVGSGGGNKEIFLMDLDGRNVVSVTRNGSINLSPSFSSDGRQLAWTSYRKGNADVFVKDMATGRTRAVSTITGVNLSPEFTSDGTRLIVARTVDAEIDLFSLDARTGAVLQQITKGGGIDVSPDLGPGDALLAFASERSGGSQVHVRNMATGESRRVSFAGDYNSDPVISPDGTQIAFVTREAGGFDIVVADIDGRNVRRITQGMGDNEDPCWSPDGMYLLFSSTRSGRSEIWASTADGNHHTQITRTGGWTQPAWMP